MNCANCGAAMRLLSDRGYFYCEYCGSFHFPDTADTEGAILTGPASTPKACPLCSRALSAAMLEGYQVLACDRCKGMLMPRQTFARVITVRRARDPRTVVPGSVKPFDVTRHLTCPSCAGDMFTHRYFGPGNIIIDTCEQCDLLWLDPGEFTRIVQAPGRDKMG